MKRNFKIGIIVFLFIVLLPIYKINAQITNTGFIPGNIWYSKDPFEEGDKIKIYTLIFNPDTRELSGTVIFFDKTILLGKKNFIVPAKGVKDISIDWTITVGNHNVFAKIENAKFLISTGKYENVNLPENQTEESSRTVSRKILNSPNTITSNPVSGQIQNVQKLIIENTPDFIAQPIILTVDKIEAIRKNAGLVSQNKKVEVGNQIKAYNEKITPKSAPNNKLLKPIKYIELFFLSIFSIIFNNKLIFYAILVFMVFLIVRYFWHKIF